MNDDVIAHITDHVGIVEKVEDGYVCTVEGNTTTAAPAEGIPSGIMRYRGMAYRRIDEKTD